MLTGVVVEVLHCAYRSCYRGVAMLLFHLVHVPNSYCHANITSKGSHDGKVKVQISAVAYSTSDEVNMALTLDWCSSSALLAH